MRVFLNIHHLDSDLANTLARHLQPLGITAVLPEPDLAAHSFCSGALFDQIASVDGVLYLNTAHGPDFRQTIAYYQALERAETEAGFILLPVTTTGQFPSLRGLHSRPWLQVTAPLDEQTVEHIRDALSGKEDHFKNHRPCCAFRPFTGLAPMTVADAAVFFGRERETELILDSIRSNERRMLTLVGPAAVGKTSLVAAGIMGALQAQFWPQNQEDGEGGKPWPRYLRDSRRWAYLTVKPGSNPLREVIHALISLWTGVENHQKRIEHVDRWTGYLRHGGRLTELIHSVRQSIEQEGREPPWRILLFIDQFEELYSQTRPGEAARFSQLLSEALDDPSLVVIAALRSSDYGCLQRDRDLFARVKSFDITPLSKTEIETSVRQPLAQLGVEFEQEDELKALISAAAEHPAGLPLLRVLLAGMWSQMCAQSSNKLTVPDKTHWQHLEKSLALRADAFLEAHSHIVETVRRLLLYKLIQVDSSGREQSRRLKQSRCTGDEWEILKKMARRDPGIVTLCEEEGEPAAELASTVLIDYWPRLAEWVAEEHEFKVWKKQVAERREAWERANRNQSALLDGVQLYSADHWLTTRNEFILPDDRDYVQLSLTRAEKRQKRQLRNLRLFGLLMVSVALGLTAAGFAMHGALTKARIEAKSAKQQETLARINEGKAYAERNDALLTQSHILADLSGKIVETGDAVTGMLLAMEALPDVSDPTRRPYVDGAEAALYQALYSRRELKVLTAHQHFISSVDFSPDGSRVVTASHDRTARIWDVRTQRELAVLRGHQGILWSARFSPDGKQVATASQDGQVRLWDGFTGRLLRTFKGHKGGVLRAVFSPEGDKLLTASEDETARIWDVATGKQLQVFRGHINFVVSAAFNHYGNRAVTTSYDLTARIWNTNNGERVAVLKGHKGYVVDAAFNDDDTLVATVSYDGTVRLWDAWSGEQLMMMTGHRRAIYSVQFSADGSRLLTASGDHTARVWDAQTGKTLLLLQGHTDGVYSARFSADENKIITSSLDKTARIWDAKTGEELAVLRGHESYVRAALSPDGHLAVTGSGDKTVRFWDARDEGVSHAFLAFPEGVTTALFHPQKPLLFAASKSGAVAAWDVKTQRKIITFKGHSKDVYAMQISRDGRRLLTASLDGTARVWDITSGEELLRLQGRGQPIRMVFTPDGEHVLTFATGNNARLWEIATKTAVKTFKGHTGKIMSVAFSSDGGKLATASTDRTVRVWDVATGAQIRLLKGHRGAVTQVTFSPDGHLLLTASEDHTVRLWEARTGRQLSVLGRYKARIKNVAFSADATRVVITVQENTAYVHSVRTGRKIAGLRHEFNINSARFSPDGKKILTASDDGTARLWDGWTGTRLAVLRGHKNVVSSAAFSADGTMALTASHDGRVRVWPIFATTQALLDYAKTVVPRCLNPEQRKRLYLLPTPPQWCKRFEAEGGS